MKKMLIVVMLVLCMACLLGGCGGNRGNKSNNSDIIGKWKVEHFEEVEKPDIGNGVPLMPVKMRFEKAEEKTIEIQFTKDKMIIEATSLDYKFIANDTIETKDINTLNITCNELS